ncbi:hypothetical protein DH2020_047623 [Rehmannia glutinosa]|uniref:MATH domain-containing protein n=1 Tax=Rehmannia glutinosa TaxID=99300 RepID=A0ABR0U8V5_REHGL
MPEFTKETRDASPAHFLIRIESFSLLSKHGIKEYESREFVAGDYKWHKSEKEGNHVSVYLAMAGTSSLPVDWEVNAVFSIFLYNQILDNYLCFRGFLVDDNCVFGAEVFVIKSQRVVECVSLRKVPVPYKRDWKISGFSELGNVWISEEFTAGDHKWNVELYPDGDIREKGRNVSVFLRCVDSKSFAPDEKLIIFASPPAASHSETYSIWFTSSATNWGWSEFIPIAEMRKGFIVDDCCFLEIDISVQAVVRNAPYPNSN